MHMADSGFRPGMKSIIFSIIVIGILALGTLIYNHYFEYKEIEETTGYSRIANLERLLAAKRYLKEFDYQVEQIKGLDFFSELPPTDHTIILNTLPAELPQSYYDDLLQWIVDGGHLIAGIGGNATEDNAISNFVGEFDITIDYYEWWKEDEYVTRKITFTLPGNNEALSIDHDVTYPLNLHGQNVVFSIPYEEQFMLAQVTAGAGHLTVSSDFGIFSNYRIGDNDHALLLSRLVESTDSNKLWINDTFKGFKGLFSLIWEHYKWVVLMLAALLLLWLRYASVRLGPLENFPDTQSNNFAQHLLAVARFHFRHGNTQQLLAPTREKVISSMIAGRPGSDEEIVKTVASRSKLPEKQVQHALFGNASNHTTFTNAAITLKQLMSLTSRQRH